MQRALSFGIAAVCALALGSCAGISLAQIDSSGKFVAVPRAAPSSTAAPSPVPPAPAAQPASTPADAPPAASAPAVISLTAVRDGFVRDGTYAPNNNGGATELEVKGVSAAGFNRRTYIAFDLGPASSAAVGQATLKLWFTKSGGKDIRIYSLPDAKVPWDEGTLNWDNQPGKGAPVGLLTMGKEADQYYSADVSAFVQGAAAEGGLLTFILEDELKTEKVHAVASRESGEHAPRLEIAEAMR